MVVINNLNTIIELLSFTSSFYFVFSLLNWYVIAHLFSYAKSLKITKGNQNPYIEERTDNTMTKRKNTKGQTSINKTYI